MVQYGSLHPGMLQCPGTTTSGAGLGIPPLVQYGSLQSGMLQYAVLCLVLDSRLRSAMLLVRGASLMH